MKKLRVPLSLQLFSKVYAADSVPLVAQRNINATVPCTVVTDTITNYYKIPWRKQVLQLHEIRNTGPRSGTLTHDTTHSSQWAYMIELPVQAKHLFVFFPVEAHTSEDVDAVFQYCRGVERTLARCPSIRRAINLRPPPNGRHRRIAGPVVRYRTQYTTSLCFGASFANGVLRFVHGRMNSRPSPFRTPFIPWLPPRRMVPFQYLVAVQIGTRAWVCSAPLALRTTPGMSLVPG